MPKPYSNDLRARVVDACVTEGQTQKEVAMRFSVCEKTVLRWVGRFRESGSVSPARMGGAHNPRIVDDAGVVVLLGFLDCAPDMTLPELSDAYLETRGIKVSPQTLSDTVRRAGYTKKKRSSARRRRVAPT